MYLLRRVLRFLRIHALNNPLYILAYAVSLLLPKFKLDVQFYRNEQLPSLLEQGKSFIRFGDGEIYIMNRGSIHYQKYDEGLRRKFLEIVRNYKETSPYVIGLNEITIQRTNYELRERNLLHCWLPMKVYFFLFFPKSMKYLDQAMFYYNETFPKYLEGFLIDKKLIVVSRAKNIDSLQLDPSFTFANVSYIETPEENAFSEYDNIVTRIREQIHISRAETNKEVVILAAFGPASKVLAYDLSMEGDSVTVIDIGRGIEILYKEERIDHIIYPEWG